MQKTEFAPPPGSRAVLYLWVSTGKQAEKDLSIPDQRKQLKAFCKHSALIFSGEYKDAKSGRDDKRPGFQDMIEDIRSGVTICDVIVVHSFSRFFRDEVESTLYMRSLAKRGVRVVSLTQNVDDSPVGQLVRRFFGLFDEYTSLETSKHVTRSLHENANQGFYNGGVPAYGFRSVEVERRGSTAKKQLRVNEAEAKVVRMMYDLYLIGDGNSGPMGVKAITGWLNQRGYRTRENNRWGINSVHRRLTYAPNIGDYIYHSSENGGVDIELTVPAIVSEDIFDLTQANLKAKNPKKTPPQTIAGDVLLTGLATCPKCGGGMTTRTGKGGRYRYYSCSLKLRQTSTACDKQDVPMDALDKIVTRSLMTELLSIKKISAILQPLLDRQGRSNCDKQIRLAEREEEVLCAKKHLDQLYKMIENDLVEMADPDFKERFQRRKEQLKKAKLERNQVAAEMSPTLKVSHERVASYVEKMRTVLEQRPIKMKKGYIWSIVDQIEIGDEAIRIYGRTSQMERAVMSDKITPSVVPTSVQGWRRDRDSNPGNP